MLGNADRERVREASPLDQIIAEYGVALRKDGRNFTALCPFHKEKTPSFKVDPERGTFRCFGCGENGDVFSFVQKIDALDFRGALSMLAERAGIELTGSFRKGATPRRDEREADLELVGWAARWFVEQRNGRLGAPARDYLARRGFEESSVHSFAVGYAPPGWGGLTDAMRAASLDLDRGVRLGLLKQSPEGRVYDAFRQRVIFPIRDTRSRVIGFGGRHLELEGGSEERRGGDPPPKYINSPESDLFHKGAILYGQYEGHASIRSARSLLLMEGYTDVMMAHQRGFDTAVATLGTALTEANVDRVVRVADRVTLVFDGDRAGIEAARKAVLLFAAKKVELRVVILERGDDPCEMLVREDGPTQFRERLDRGAESLDFMLERAFDGEDASSAGGRDRASRQFFEYVDKLPSAIVRGTALERLAGRVGTGFDGGGFGRVERAFTEWRSPRRKRRIEPEPEMPTGGSALPSEEEGVILAAMVGDAQMRALLQLVGPDRFRDPLLGRIAMRLRDEGVDLDPLAVEVEDEKVKLLELDERRRELKISEESALRLLVELVRKRLNRLARGQRERLAAGSGDRDQLIRWISEIQRMGATLGSRPPQDPGEIVEILARFESGPTTEADLEPRR